MISKQGSRLTLCGAMTIPNVNALLDEVAPLFTEPEMEMDLAQVSEVDSTAVSLLFEWLRLAHTRNAKLFFVNVPKILLSLAALYGVDEILAQYTH